MLNQLLRATPSRSFGTSGFTSFFLGILLSGAFIAFPALAQKETPKKPLSNAQIQFAEKVHDFGDVNQGDVVTCKFQFQNTGTEPLMLLQVQTTCGCTAPEWTKKPVPPGESGEIVVTFNSAKKMGRINKVITVYTNGQKPEEKLKIVANILPADGDSPPSDSREKNNIQEGK